MNDNQLKSFLKIVETGSFSKAARNNYISVAAIVEQMDRLEEELNVKLFYRTNHGVSLTDKGTTFYKAVVNMKKIYDQALSDIGKESESLTIGIAPNQCPDFFINACTSFHLKYPHIKIHLEELPYEQHLNHLRNGTIDLTLIAKPKQSELKSLIYYEVEIDTYSFGLSANHPLASKNIIQKSDLKGMDILCGTYQYMETPFQKFLSSTHSNLQVIPSEYTMESRVQARFKNSILIFHSLWKSCYSQMFKIVPSTISAGSVGIVTTKDKKDIVLKSFIDILKQEKDNLYP